MRLIQSAIAIMSIPLMGAGLNGSKLSGGKVNAVSGGAWADTFGPCTAGTDCFCDVIGTTGTVNGPYSGIFWCADFDHDAFYATTPTDVNDSFGNKNWISTVGAIFGSGDRGGGSRWAKLYKGTWDQMTWFDGQPTTTCGGVITAVGGSGIGSGPKEWDASDRWCANGYEPRIDIIGTSTDFSAESGSTVPTIPGSGGASIFGDNLLGMRVDLHSSQGFMSDITGLGDHSQLGITASVGYESNVTSSNILSNPWKHEEFGGVTGGINDGLFMFRQSNGPLNTFPIQGFLFPIGFTCSTAISGAVQTFGTIVCDAGGNITYYAEQGAGTNQYVWPDDFSASEPHCVSVYWDFRTISSVDFIYWVDGDKVLDISNINLTGSVYDGGGGTNGVDSFNLNNYSNQATDSGSGGGGGINAPTRRFMDNYVMRDGTPVLCADIGFPTSHNQAGL